jgi:hypothetical protein
MNKRDGVSFGHAGISSGVGIPGYRECGVLPVVEGATMSGASSELCW